MVNLANPPRRRTWYEEYFEHVDALAKSVQDYSASVAQLIASNTRNGVLWSGTIMLAASGTYVLDTKVPFGSVTIAPRTTDVVVSPGGEAPSPPQQGPGVFTVRCGMARTWAVRGTQLVFYGIAGGIVEVTLWIRAQPPQHAETQPDTCDATAPARIAGANASTVLAAANTIRRGLLIYNENVAANTLYVCLGSPASITNYTVQVAGGSFFELPPTRTYRGIVTGIVPAATGQIQVTELVAI